MWLNTCVAEEWLFGFLIDIISSVSSVKYGLRRDCFDHTHIDLLYAGAFLWGFYKSMYSMHSRTVPVTVQLTIGSLPDVQAIVKVPAYHLT